ncbi:MAG: TatD DNase family protein, partial [Pseudomonadota bacterium]|nr:TatD DNase family protein [Pseudomonadota bacterium]
MTVEQPPRPQALPAGVADSHCHLDMGTDGHTAFPPDSDEVREAIRRAGSVGVQTIIQVGCDVEGSRWSAVAADLYPQVWATVAL